MNIDFVIAWVDGNDPTWRIKKIAYENKREATESDLKDVYYRDWDLLRYLFRSIDTYAPWVHKVYLVTDNQVPQWLRVEEKKGMRLPDSLASKLVIVNHEDFIPKEYLPTFSSHAIELNLHRIPGLCEQFVYFNDDFFLTNPVAETDYFKEGLPVDEATLNGINGRDELFASIQFANLSLMNQHYDRSDITRNLGKWLKPTYGKNFIRTLCLLPFHRLQSIYNHHGPMALLKTTYQTLWDRDGEILDATCRRKVRSPLDVSCFCMRYEQLLSGEFVPKKSGNQYLEVTQDLAEIKKAMARAKSICLNDVDGIAPEFYETRKKELLEIFEEKYPNKSQYEK